MVMVIITLKSYQTDCQVLYFNTIVTQINM